MVVGGKLDVAVEKMAHLALTTVCEQRLVGMADMSITLFPIWNQDNPKWCQCLGAACNLTWEQFNVEWEPMTRYAKYLFNLQHKTSRIMIEQCTHLDA
jgi:hypothetical protein